MTLASALVFVFPGSWLSVSFAFWALFGVARFPPPLLARLGCLNPGDAAFAGGYNRLLL